MKVEKEMKYEAPEVVILEVDVEEGFAASPTDSDKGLNQEDGTGW